jgi:hypothetical protein
MCEAKSTQKKKKKTPHLLHVPRRYIVVQHNLWRELYPRPCLLRRGLHILLRELEPRRLQIAQHTVWLTWMAACKREGESGKGAGRVREGHRVSITVKTLRLVIRVVHLHSLPHHHHFHRNHTVRQPMAPWACVQEWWK